MGHTYIGHNYMSQNYIGHNCRGHAYIGPDRKACRLPVAVLVEFAHVPLEFLIRKPAVMAYVVMAHIVMA